MPVVDLLEWLDRRRPNGELTVQRGTLTRRMETVNGVVTRAASSYPTEQLGRILVGSGAVSEEDLAVALAESDVDAYAGVGILITGSVFTVAEARTLLVR